MATYATATTDRASFSRKISPDSDTERPAGRDQEPVLLRALHPRRADPVDRAITLYGEGSFSSGVVRSLDGDCFFLETVQFLEVDDRVHFDLNTTAGRVRVRGEVAWVRENRGYDRYPPGMAIRLTDAGPEVREAIESLERTR